jgi:hypothetical protein
MQRLACIAKFGLDSFRDGGDLDSTARGQLARYWIHPPKILDVDCFDRAGRDDCAAGLWPICR